MKVTLSLISMYIVLCLALVMFQEATSAPASPDYDSVRDLYEMLVQREALADGLAHQVVRKNNNRSPQVRLRFGRRSDPYMYQAEHGLDSSLDSFDN